MVLWILAGCTKFCVLPESTESPKRRGLHSLLYLGGLDGTTRVGLCLGVWEDARAGDNVRLWGWKDSRRQDDVSPLKLLCLNGSIQGPFAFRSAKAAPLRPLSA